MTLGAVISAVGDFTTTYEIFIFAGLVIGLGAFTVGRILRAGR